MYSPTYIELHRTGELAERADALRKLASPCGLCPHGCRASRDDSTETGVCGSALPATVSSAFAHFGEEAPLVGAHGSGTIFLCGCNLRCSFCQNWEISHDPAAGPTVNDTQLAGLMLDLQRQGCHNINLVTPTHYNHAIVSALSLAIESGLNLPLVYNCGGYESLETLRLLDGVIDIYMPDVKFFDNATAARYLSCSDYATRARETLLEMHRQVGNLSLTPMGTAYRGLLIRHLVLPENLAGTEQWAGWIAENLSPDSYVNIMGQYRPCHVAKQDQQLGRAPAPAEIEEAKQKAREAGLAGRGFLYE